MNDREILLNSIFFPRPSFKEKDEKDYLIEVEDDIHVAARFFLRDKNYLQSLWISKEAPWKVW